ncbi:hypothetical protein GCM10023314_12600 [Algibacter agarivorans]|uniref:Outer membrane protein beta-barrel domain-containing protein n=1 Tax=Algibacter agarivorans TaxID=1109741 RepID=A0ABP9GFJ9_9FLAO
MKPHAIKLFGFILFFILNNSVFGQDNSETNLQIKDKVPSYFSLSLGFINDAVFLGRKDSISAPYLYPSISYYNKSGFYATGSFSYLTKSNESRIDLFLGTVGYDFAIKKFDGDISFTKYFFNSDSYNVIAEVEADITAMFSYDFNIINLAASATTFFNTNGKVDIILSSEISHDFITKNQKIQISPTIGVFFGSQNFYEEYYINTRLGSRKGSGSGHGTGGTTITETTVVLNESEKFDLMAFEFSLPIWYIHKPFAITFLPVWAIPKTPATLTAEDVIYEEDLENSFYWLIGASYTF